MRKPTKPTPLDLLKRALPALRVWRGMARGEKGRLERARFLVEVSEAIQDGERIDKKHAKKTRRTTRAAVGTCSSCGSINEFCVKANADLSKVEADCGNCEARLLKLEWKVC
jgi:hypothetical protein